MVDKECVTRGVLHLLKVVILLIKEWTTVNSSCNFCTVELHGGCF